MLIHFVLCDPQTLSMLYIVFLKALKYSHIWGEVENLDAVLALYNKKIFITEKNGVIF